MNPGLVIKLRPTGPWRIGPDSGARNRVDSIYHSDTLYSAVSSAMARFGLLEAWLDATARGAQARSGSQVCFSSCFPFQDEIGFVIPPRTIWPPASPALISARVRWKSARFVPLGIVQALLAGQTLDENHWTIDGPSECLIPAGRPGPFRSSVRSNAAVDRMSGATERHTTACLEFRSGAGLWGVVSFLDSVSYERWLEPVKAAFRLLADSGFGGERSRGWGRSEAPEFIDGMLPDLILGSPAANVVEPVPATEAPAHVPDEPSPVPPVEEPPSEPGVPPIEEPPAEPSPEQLPPAEPDPPTTAPAAPQAATIPEAARSHWLLSLFSPAPADTVDWRRGNYSLLTRGGRVESSAGYGELKKQVNMVAEGSVLFAATDLRGGAPDVAPEGFAHPVFRSGFAVSIPLPEVS